MPMFSVEYGVGGGYNDITQEVLEFPTLDLAQEYAYESAVEVFESYGIFENEYEVDNDMDEGQYEEAYCECVESWCNYSAELVEDNDQTRT